MEQGASLPRVELIVLVCRLMGSWAHRTRLLGTTSVIGVLLLPVVTWCSRDTVLWKLGVVNDVVVCLCYMGKASFVLLVEALGDLAFLVVCLRRRIVLSSKDRVKLGETCTSTVGVPYLRLAAADCDLACRRLFYYHGKWDSTKSEILQCEVLPRCGRGPT